ncbi:ABC transporter permease [Guggenheimella bovis]
MSKLKLSMIAILLAFIIASFVMVLTGINPINFFIAIIRTISGYDLQTGNFNPRYIGEFVQMSLPIILAGLSVGFAFRTGLFNIGGEGQLLMGSLGAVAVGILFKLPPVVHVALAILVAGLLGALWGVIPGFLKAKFGVHEVVVTIMLNYVALYVSALLLKMLPGSDNQKTVTLPDSALLQSDWLTSLTGGSRLHWGFIIVLVALFLYHFIITRTTFGYELRAVGFNNEAAEYAGIPVSSRIIASMALAGFFAGLGGSMLSLGTFDYGRVLYGFENYGFDGLAVALLGGNNAFGILFAGLLFGALKSSQALMQFQKIPLEITNIVTGLIILFVAMQNGIEYFFMKRKNGGKR